MVDLVLQYTYSPLEHTMNHLDRSPATAAARLTRMRLARRRSTELQRRLAIARTLRAV